jgi:hypothetical protein
MVVLLASLPCSCYNKMETSPNIESILEISPFVKSTRCVPHEGKKESDDRGAQRSTSVSAAQTP